MTDTRPDVLGTVTDRSQSLSETVCELREYKSTVEEYRNRVDNMSSNEREMFDRSTASMRVALTESADPETILETRDTLEEAVRSPLQTVARESLVALLGRLPVSLGEREREQVLDGLESKLPAELETVTETYQQLYARIDGFDAVVPGLLAEVVAERPSILLTPAEEFAPIVDSLEASHERLLALETVFAESDWAPTLEFAGVERFYADDGLGVDLQSIRSDVEDISTALATLRDHGIEIKAALVDDVTDTYEAGAVGDLVDALDGIARTVTAAADTCTTVADFVAELEATAHSSGAFESELTDLLESYESVRTHDYSTLEYAAQSVESVAEDVDSFVEVLHRRLRTQQELVAELDPAEPEAPGPPEPRLEQRPLLPTHVRDEPVDALAEFADRQEWLTSHLETSVESVDQEQVLETMQSLTQGEAVPLTPENRDRIMALADRLSISVVLTDR
jgi:hypothetical protein